MVGNDGWNEYGDVGMRIGGNGNEVRNDGCGWNKNLRSCWNVDWKICNEQDQHVDNDCQIWVYVIVQNKQAKYCNLG